MSGDRGAVADQVPGDRHGQGPCTCSGSVGADVRRDQAGDDHQEPDRARNLPALPQREEEAMGWGVLDRRLLREHGWPARQRADDWRLGQTAGLHLPEASPGPPAGAVPIANNSPLAAGIFYLRCGRDRSQRDRSLVHGLPRPRYIRPPVRRSGPGERRDHCSATVSRESASLPRCEVRDCRNSVCGP